jgi:hypothetical protein
LTLTLTDGADRDRERSFEHDRPDGLTQWVPRRDAQPPRRARTQLEWLRGVADASLKNDRPAPVHPRAVDTASRIEEM